MGLLLLRAAVGTTAVVEGVLYFQNFSESSAGSAGQLAGPSVLILGGAALLVGCLTPIAGFLSGACFAAIFLGVLPPQIGGLADSKAAAVRIVIVSIAIILLGPGGFSLDAYLFGRREIVIPPVSRNPDEL